MRVVLRPTTTYVLLLGWAKNKLRPILLVLTAVAALSFAYPVRANTITAFNVSGICTPFAPFTGTTFGGTLTIDLTAGTITAIDVSFQGLSAFNTIDQVGFVNSSIAVVQSGNGVLNNFLTLAFTTEPTPGSPVGFTGGTILGAVLTIPEGTAYSITGGSITAPAGVPDGGSTVGCALLGLTALRRKLGC